jgi:hypothetical protein
MQYFDHAIACRKGFGDAAAGHGGIASPHALTP